jgi:SAM-dependent methyltransferase
VNTAEDRQRLRARFTEDAELYDRMRPTYPSAVFDAIAEFGTLNQDSRVLEIGPGTGKATVSLAARGYRVIAVELGEEMATVAHRNLAAYPHAEIVVAPFEEWSLPSEPFDAIVSATAWHWLDPSVRVTKAAAALRPNGVLAIIGTHHILGGTVDFFEEVQRCYERWDPATPPDLHLQPADAIPKDSSELDTSGLFIDVEFHRYEWNAPYTADEYRNLLLTYSGHRDLDPDRQSNLLECITTLIRTRHGGAIEKRYMTELLLARRPTEQLGRGGEGDPVSCAS